VDDRHASFLLTPYRFDTATGTLWHGKRARRLRPRAAALLCFLLERRGALVTSADILAALWPDVQVGQGVVKVHVWEIRQALRDRPARPRFLATVPGRGYRWIGDATPVPPDAAAAPPAGPALVGRAVELARLRAELARAERGERRLVLVTGEAGIGKSALVAELLGGLPAVTTAVGECIEQIGPGEAYLPVLSALGELARGPRRRSLIRVLARHAPTWLVQLPDALAATDRDAATRAAAGATRERMLRELSTALELLTVRTPLVLALEDLQWSDASTLDLLALLARRTRRARLLVVATFRPADAASRDHPLQALLRELEVSQSCTRLPVAFLGPDDVARFLATRLATAPPGGLAELAGAIHERTEGNPLFMVNVVDHLLGDRVASRPLPPADALARVRTAIPPRLDQAIEARLARLSDVDRELLEAAGAVGREASAAAIAAACDAPVVDVERRCAEIARRAQLLEASGEEEWPDGTVAGRFRFVHEMYQSVLARRLTPARRRATHRRVAARLEQAYGARASEIAPALAAHREQAGDAAQAIAHLEAAAQNALAKHANAEAARHLARAIELLPRTPDAAGHAQRELALQVRLGAPLLQVRGYAAPEVSRAYGRALELCGVVGEGPQQLLALAGIYRFALIRSELRTAHAIAVQVLDFARRSELPLAVQIGHLLLGITTFGLGEPAVAREHLQASLALHDPASRALLTASFGDDPEAICLSHLAMTEWFLGDPDGSLARVEQALARARDGGQPQSLVFALSYATWCRLLRHEGSAASALAAELVRVAAEHDLAYWRAQAEAMAGWVALELGDLAGGEASLRRGLDAYAAIGAEVMRPWHLVRLAEAYRSAGRIDDGLAALRESDAVMRAKDERFYEAELYRVEAELRLAANDVPRAIECATAALATARRQQARSLELRAATSLARIESRAGRDDGARAALARLLASFDGASPTGDLRAAHDALGERA